MLPDLTVFHAVKIELQPYRYEYLRSGHQHHSVEIRFIDDKGNEIGIRLKAFHTEIPISVSHDLLRVIEINK